MIYFLQEDVPDGLIKIGHTEVSAQNRARATRTYNGRRIKILGTCEGDRRVEDLLHKKFSTRHVRGDWFRPAPELLTFIAGLPKHEPRSAEPAQEPARNRRIEKDAEYAKLVPNYHEEMHKKSKELVTLALRATTGNTDAAARALGITRQSLYRIMERPERASRKGVGGSPTHRKK